MEHGRLRVMIAGSPGSKSRQSSQALNQGKAHIKHKGFLFPCLSVINGGSVTWPRRHERASDVQEPLSSRLAYHGHRRAPSAVANHTKRSTNKARSCI